MKIVITLIFNEASHYYHSLLIKINLIATHILWIQASDFQWNEAAVLTQGL